MQMRKLRWTLSIIAACTLGVGAVVAQTSVEFSKIPGELRTTTPAPVEIDIKSGKSKRLGAENYDDIDHKCRFRIRLTSLDWREAQPNLQGELYILGEDASVKKGAYTLVMKERFPVDLPATREAQEYEMPELILTYDDKAFARYGNKYLGYVFLLKNSQNQIVGARSSLGWAFPLVQSVQAMETGQKYNKKLEIINTVGR